MKRVTSSHRDIFHTSGFPHCPLAPVRRREGWGEGRNRELRNSAHRPSPQPSPLRTGEREQSLKWIGILLLSLLSCAALAAEPSTLTTRDGRIQVQLPDGYDPKTPPRKEIQLEATNDAEGTTILIISESQREFDSLQAYAELVRQAMTARLKDPQADAGEKLELNGNPAIRYEITGISTNGLRMAFQVTIIQTETRFSQVIGSSLRSRFTDRKEEFAKVAGSLKELPAKPEEKSPSKG